MCDSRRIEAFRITWLGHSTALIELDGMTFLTDPLLRRRVAHLRRSEPVDLGSLPKPDAVLISHVHMDHMDLPSLGRLGRALPVIAPPGAARILSRRGHGDVSELAVGESLPVGPVTVTATAADHHVRRVPLAPVTPALGYLVTGSRSVYFAGDTGLFAGLEEYAGPDVALLPVAGWGARLPPGHMSPLDAARALTVLRPEVAIPIHWGTYAPLHRAPAQGGPELEFVRHAELLAPDVRVEVLGVGASYEAA